MPKRRKLRRYRIGFPFTRDPGFEIFAPTPQEALRKAKRKRMLRGFPTIWRVGSKIWKETFGQ